MKIKQNLFLRSILHLIVFMQGMLLFSVPLRAEAENKPALQESSIPASTIAPTQSQFRKVVPGYVFSFPRDHGIHPDFASEWWYFTGHLSSPEGRRFGFQWTVFRRALLSPQTFERMSSSMRQDSNGQKSPWRAREIYAGHFAISDLDAQRFYVTDSMHRSALELAGGSEKTLHVWLPRFTGELQSDGTLILQARDFPQNAQMAMDFRLDFRQKIILQGEQGFSQKASESQYASYYYSLPRIPLQGTLRIAGQDFQVSGEAWMDHEFGSSKLAPTQKGWDWFALSLGEKASLMIFRVRDTRGSEYDYYAGTLIRADGTQRHLDKKDIRLTPLKTWRSPQTQGIYPIEWRVQIPDELLDVTVQAEFPQQELNTPRSTQIQYWEGAVSVEGKFKAQEIRALGYLEMTGYVQSMEKRL